MLDTKTRVFIGIHLQTATAFMTANIWSTLLDTRAHFLLGQFPRLFPCGSEVAKGDFFDRLEYLRLSFTHVLRHHFNKNKIRNKKIQHPHYKLDMVNGAHLRGGPQCGRSPQRWPHSYPYRTPSGSSVRAYPLGGGQTKTLGKISVPSDDFFLGHASGKKKIKGAFYY